MFRVHIRINCSRIPKAHYYVRLRHRHKARLEFRQLRLLSAGELSAPGNSLSLSGIQRIFSRRPRSHACALKEFCMRVSVLLSYKNGSLCDERLGKGEP